MAPCLVEVIFYYEYEIVSLRIRVIKISIFIWIKHHFVDHWVYYLFDIKYLINVNNILRSQR